MYIQGGTGTAGTRSVAAPAPSVPVAVSRTSETDQEATVLLLTRLPTRCAHAQTGICTGGEQALQMKLHFYREQHKVQKAARSSPRVV